MSISFANNDMQQEDIQSKKRVSVASQERASPCLLTLPPENRSMIYEYAAAGAELTYATEGDHTATALSNHFGMLRICKLVTHEARPILYWAMQVTVNSWSKIYAELNQHIPTTVRQALPRLEIPHNYLPWLRSCPKGTFPVLEELKLNGVLGCCLDEDKAYKLDSNTPDITEARQEIKSFFLEAEAGPTNVIREFTEAGLRVRATVILEVPRQQVIEAHVYHVEWSRWILNW